MSVSVMSAVWRDSRAKGSELLLLLAIADFADDSGIAFPSVPTLAEKVRLSERSVHYLIKILQASGELVITAGGGRGRANTYRINHAANFTEKIAPCKVFSETQRTKRVQPSAERVQSGAERVQPIAGQSSYRSTIDPPKEPSVRARKPALIPLTEVEREKLLVAFPHPDTPENIEMALAHENALKYPTGQYLYVRGWLRRWQEWKSERNGNGNGTRTTANSHSGAAGVAAKFAAYD